MNHQSRMPAFLSDHQRGLETRARTNQSPRISWRPDASTRMVLRAVEAMPKLATSIGLSIAAHPDASVEILPGAPTTVAFTTGGKLKGLIVLPVEVNDARQQLGLPQITTRDLTAEALFEEQREVSLPDELLAEAQHEAWGL